MIVAAQLLILLPSSSLMSRLRPALLASAAVTDAILELRDAGTATLLIEGQYQNALRVADTLAVMSLEQSLGQAQGTDVEGLSANTQSRLP